MEAPDKSIFIGNLSEEMCESTVAEYCSTYGALSKCRLMTDPVTKSMRRFGFISFRNPHSTYKFLTNIPHYICGRQVAVKPIKKNHRLTDDVLITNKKRLLACCISNSAIAEATVFEYLTSFGAIKQVIHHHQSGNKGCYKYWILEFQENGAVEKCLTTHQPLINGSIRLYIRLILSSEESMRKKRSLTNPLADMEQLSGCQAPLKKAARFTADNNDFCSNASTHLSSPASDLKGYGYQ